MTGQEFESLLQSQCNVQLFWLKFEGDASWMWDRGVQRVRGRNRRAWVMEAKAGDSVESKGYLSAFGSGEQSGGKAEALMAGVHCLSL